MNFNERWKARAALSVHLVNICYLDCNVTKDFETKS